MSNNLTWLKYLVQSNYVFDISNLKSLFLYLKETHSGQISNRIRDQVEKQINELNN